MKTRALLSSSLVSLTLLLAACGAGTTPDQNSGSTSTGAGGAGGGTTTGTGGAGGGTGGSGGSGTGGDPTGTGGGGTGGGGGGLLPTITNFDFFMNCMPIVPPDPVSGSFTVDYDNDQGAKASTANIKDARLIFDNDESKSWTFEVTPATSNIVDAGKSVTLSHLKDTGSGVGTVSPCNQCKSMWSLEVLFEIDGKDVLRTTDPQPAQCAF